MPINPHKVGRYRGLQIIKSQVIVVFLLFMSLHSSGQMKVFHINWNLSDTIKSIYTKYLLPPLTNADEEVVSFWHNYENQPEYTLRITKGKDNQHYLEGRFLTKKIGESMSSLIEHPEKPLAIEVKFLSIPVSDQFQRNMRSAFIKTLDCQKLNKVYEGPWALDGIYYNFRIKTGNNEILESSLYEPEESNPCYQTIQLCKQIAAAINNQTFEESKYLERLRLNN
ncbi:MAG TPA: hypothetical protein DCL77_04960 [Prolixibacteraceae bacterium]|jgi:hypothetical protein|nr:hypothetical protein [Prolixibacteraceae bacterium]